MVSKLCVRIAATAALAFGLAASAQATMYSWQFTAGMPQPPMGSYGVNNDAGSINVVSSTFDNVTKRLTFDASFGTVSGSLVTRGFWLALNNGPNPKTHGGEMALFYFDASNLMTPRLTTYVYNGVNGPNSWNDGNGDGAGSPTGDLIHGALEMSSYVQSIGVTDTGSGASAQRTLSFSIDATAILAHTPLFPSTVGDPWFGTGFDNKLGIWMHPVRSFNAAYDSTRGRITSLSLGTQGWLDGTNFDTQIPTPGAMGLGVAGVVLAARRRRKHS
jgi:MYXO-CTERM domain-containing protein